MVDHSCPGQGRRFLGRLVDLVHDGVEAAMAFDGVPIGISDGLPEGEDFFLGLADVAGVAAHCVWAAPVALRAPFAPPPATLLPLDIA